MITIAIRYIKELCAQVLRFDRSATSTRSNRSRLRAVVRTAMGRNGAVEVRVNSGLLNLNLGIFDTTRKKPRAHRTDVDDVLALSAIEPLLLAPGRNAIENLPKYEIDTDSTFLGIDASLIVLLEKVRPSVIIIAPWFARVGGGEHYCRALAKALNELGKTVLVIATAGDPNDFTKLFDPSKTNAVSTSILQWNDYALVDQRRPDMLVRLVNLLAPEKLVVANSRIGLDSLCNVETVLHEGIQKFAIFFGMDSSKVAAQYGIVFGKRLAPKTSIISDSSKAIERFHLLNPSRLKDDSHVLFSRISCATLETFERNLLRTEEDRFERSVDWLWLSRLSLQKGTRILGHLADLRPHDTFHVFGAGASENIKQLGLKKSNIVIHGKFDKLSDIDFSQYRGFLFTSHFEGQPLTVLEVATYGIPIISTTVGDLESLFNEEEVQFVDAELDEYDSAAAFNERIEVLKLENCESISKRLQSARRKVLQVHSAEAHFTKVKEMFVDDA